MSNRNSLLPVYFRVLAFFAGVVLVLGTQSVTGAERIYVGEFNPSLVQMFSFNGANLLREDFDPLDADPATPLVSNSEFFGMTATDRTFYLGLPSISRGFGGIDVATRVNLPTTQTSGAGTSQVVIDPSGDFAYLFDNSFFRLLVIDLRPGTSHYLEEEVFLDLSGGGRIAAMVIGPDLNTLYLALDNGGFGANGWDAKVMAIDISDPSNPSWISDTLIPDPGWDSGTVERIRFFRLGTDDYLFVMRFGMYVLQIDGPGQLSLKMQFFSTDPDVVPPGGQLRVHFDVHAQDTGSGPRAIVATGTCDDPTWVNCNFHHEMIVVDMTPPLADDFSGARVLAHPDMTAPGAATCGWHVAELKLSLDGQTLYRLDGCGLGPGGTRGALAALDLDAILTDTSPIVLDEITIDDDPTLSEVYPVELGGLVVREEINPVPGGPQISAVTSAGEVVVANDSDRLIDIGGVDLGSVHTAFIGPNRIPLGFTSAEVARATVPARTAAADVLVGLIDSSGRIGSYRGLRVVNPPDYLPANQIFASGLSNHHYRLNAFTATDATVPVNSVQGPVPVLVSGDGKHLYVGGFRDGRIGVFCAVAQSGICDWDEQVASVFVGGNPDTLVPNSAQDRLFINEISHLSVLDTTSIPPILVDIDGDAGTTDPGLPTGMTRIDLTDAGLDLWSREIALHPDGDWIYLTSYRQPFLNALPIGAHPNPDIIDPIDLVTTSIPDLEGIFGRADGLAVSPDGSTLYFTQFTDTAVRVFSIDGADHSTLTETGSIPIPNATSDVRNLRVSPDNNFLYVSNRARAVTDIFELVGSGSCGAPPCHQACVDTGDDSNQLAVDPTGEFLYVSSKGASGVVSIDLRAGSPTQFQVLAVTGTGAGSLAPAVSPGLVTPTCSTGNCDPVEPTQGVAITFDEVSGDGNTSVTSSNVTEVPLDANYLNEGLPVFYDINTDATTTGLIDVCIDYDDSSLSASQEAALKLLHQQVDASCDPPGSECFIDVTSAGFPDTGANILCGEVSDFSQFTSVIDLSSGPSNPDSFTFSHTAGAWSVDTTIDVDWSGAAQHPSGQSLAGYSIETAVSSGTLPDKVVDVAQGTDPHVQVLGPLSDGAWYFHLRTCTTDDFCAAALHFGPFGVDTSPPAWGGSLQSTSHTVGVASTVDTLDFNWPAAFDPFSGVVGFAWQVDQNGSWICDQAIDADDQTLTASAGPLGTGTYYVHVCAGDAVGHWTSAMSDGPFEVDVSGPRVLEAKTVAGNPGGVISPDERISDPITQVLLRFDELMHAGGGAGDPTSIAEYLLVRPGPDATFDTTDCASGISGDDSAVAISVAGYDSLNDTVALSVDGDVSLVGGAYRLFACGTLADTLGNQLDGQGNGSSGADFELGFEVIGTNLLRNPNFDSGLGGWTASSILPEEITTGSDDAGAAFSSGSARLEDLVGKGAPLSLSQCVPIGSVPDYTLGARVRVNSVSGSLPAVVATVFPFDLPLCSGSSGTPTELSLASGDSGGAWLSAQGYAGLPIGTASALVILASSPGSGSGSVVDLDSVFLANHTDPVFSDGFESGNTSGWSNQLP